MGPGPGRRSFSAFTGICRTLGTNQEINDPLIHTIDSFANDDRLTRPSTATLFHIGSMNGAVSGK